MRPQLFRFAATLKVIQVIIISLSLPIGGFAADTYEIRKVGTVPGTPGLENLAVRHTGDILVTSTQSGTLHQLTPKAGGGTFSSIIAEIPHASALLGIAELTHDIFYIFASNLSQANEGPYSNAVWRVDMRSFKQDKSTGHTLQPAKASLVALVPSAKLLNGMTKLDDSHILGVDSTAGNIVRINVATGHSTVTIDDPSMKPLTLGKKVGVNGVHVHGDHLYFTNLDQVVFASVPISRSGYATGPVKSIHKISEEADDFAISKDGKKAWIACHEKPILVEVDIDARKANIVANSELLNSTSAVAFTGDGGLYITGAAQVGGDAMAGALLRADLLAS